MSSGYRLYQRHALNLDAIECKHFDVLQELLVRGLVEGYSVKEIPFDYQPRLHGSSQARVFKFGLSYVETFRRLWFLRNSIASADYDARAYDSILWIQRYWQRQRYRHIVEFSSSEARCMDIGCGSSRILGMLPKGSVALDLQIRKLRYARRYQSTATARRFAILCPQPTGTPFTCQTAPL